MGSLLLPCYGSYSFKILKRSLKNCSISRRVFFVHVQQTPVCCITQSFYAVWKILQLFFYTTAYVACVLIMWVCWLCLHLNQFQPNLRVVHSKCKHWAVYVYKHRSSTYKHRNSARTHWAVYAYKHNNSVHVNIKAVHTKNIISTWKHWVVNTNITIVHADFE